MQKAAQGNALWGTEVRGSVIPVTSSWDKGSYLDCIKNVMAQWKRFIQTGGVEKTMPFTEVNGTPTCCQVMAATHS